MPDSRLINAKLHFLRAYEHVEAGLEEMKILPGRLVRMTADFALCGIRLKALCENLPGADLRSTAPGESDIVRAEEVNRKLSRVIELASSVVARRYAGKEIESLAGELATRVLSLHLSMESGAPLPAPWMKKRK